MTAMLEEPKTGWTAPHVPSKFMFLVEEHTSNYSGTAEDIPYRLLVTGVDTAQEAYEEANRYSLAHRRHVWKDDSLTDMNPEPVAFMFHADELVEVISNYLWQAADGSSIAYEVRRLPAIMHARTYRAVYVIP